jgi:hypothetical protein
MVESAIINVSHACAAHKLSGVGISNMSVVAKGDAGIEQLQHSVADGVSGVPSMPLAMNVIIQAGFDFKESVISTASLALNPRPHELPIRFI